MAKSRAESGAAGDSAARMRKLRLFISRPGLGNAGNSGFRLQRFAKECRQAGSIQLVVGYPDHRFVGRQLRQRAGIHAVDLKKIKGSLYCRPLVPVKVSLTLGKMVGIGSGDFEKVAISVDAHVLGWGYSRLQPVFGAQAGHATPRIELVPVNRVDLFPSEEDGFLFQGENRRSRLLGKAPKQSRMQRAGLPMGFLELLIGGGADT